MKYLLIFLMLFGVAYAQEPTYTPMKGNYRFKGIRVDSLFLIPSFTDTTAANGTNLDAIAGAMIRTGNDFWMRNAATTAWLQNVNVGDGSSPVMDFVNSIYKKGGTDSIFYVVAPSDTVFAYISGGGGTDSPDRINGTATGDVTADMDGFDLNIISGKYIGISTDTLTLGANDIITITSGQDVNINTTNVSISAGNDITLLTGNRVPLGPSGVANETGNVLYAYAKRDIDLSVASDTAHIPGTYMISKGTSGFSFWLPDAAEFPGQVIYIINIDGTGADIYSLGGSIVDQTTAAIGSVVGQRFAIFTSDGTDWYGYNAQ